MKAKEKKTRDSKYTSNIISRIKRFLEEKDISYRKLENMAGLPVSSVYNILNGNSSNPTIETVAAISNAMNCSIDELIGRSILVQNDQPSNALNLEDMAKHSLDSKLLEEASKAINKLLQEKNKSINVAKGITCLYDLYAYSYKNNDHSIDSNFAEWIVDKL